MYKHIAESYKLIWACEPKNYTGAAATKKWISLKNFEQVTIMIQTGAWAGGTAAVTIEQATAVAGTSNKAISFTDYWDDLSTSGTLVKKAATSNTFNLDTANKLYVIHVDDRMLDLAGGFTSVSIVIASPGANADFYAVSYLCTGGRYQQSTPPSVLID